MEFNVFFDYMLCLNNVNSKSEIFSFDVKRVVLVKLTASVITWNESHYKFCTFYSS